MTIPWNDKATLRKIENPILLAIKSCVASREFAGRPINQALLDEVGAALTRATRCPCTAFHEVALVPPGDEMVRVRVLPASGQPWTVTAFRSPMKEAA